jgi:hypothetical protein
MQSFLDKNSNLTSLIFYLSTAGKLNHYRLKAGRFKLRLKVVLKTRPEILNNVIPANAGIQIQRHSPGFRIKACPGLDPGSGMT